LRSERIEKMDIAKSDRLWARAWDAYDAGDQKLYEKLRAEFIKIQRINFESWMNQIPLKTERD
jgi:hypothetical protein